MNTLKIWLISILLCMVSCGDKTNTGGPDGDISYLSESFVQVYIFAEEMTLGESYRGFIRVILRGEEIMQHRTGHKKRYAELSNKYGDTYYNNKIGLPNQHQVIADDFISIDIRSDRDFDEAHKAGESLADIVTILATSPAKYIESGYTDVYDWMFQPIDYKIAGGSFRTYGYWPVNKRLDRLTPEDLLLMSPNVSLKFEAFPLWEKTHTITVTFKSSEKELSGETTVTFP